MKSGLTWLFASLACGICLAAPGASARIFYIDARAAAGGDGSSAHPYRTPLEARDGVRAARKTGRLSAGQAVEIVLAPGDYPAMPELTEADSGTAVAPVTWRSAGFARARLTGGRTVPHTLFKPVTEAAVRARIPEEAREKVLVADISSLLPEKIPAMADLFSGVPTKPYLFMAERLATLARWPNTGFTAFTVSVDTGIDKKTGARHPGAFAYEDPRASRWNFADGVWLNGYWTHDWNNESVRADSYTSTPSNHVIRLARPTSYGVKGGTWGGAARRFYAFNLLEELDVPGEWWLDRTRKLLYLIPPEGRALSDANITLVFSDRAILSARKLRHVRFERLAFEYTGADAVRIREAEDVRIENCRVAHAARTGIVLNGSRNILRNCEIAGVGCAGVSVSGGNRLSLTRSDTLLEGNDIHDFGLFQRTYAAGIGLNGCGITVRRNRIHEAPHSAVLYGGNEHLFEYNDVFRVLLETGDAGAYYTGRDWTTQGNILRYNFTHELGASNKNASDTMGFYFDDCDCGDAVYGNIFWKVSRGIMIGGGRDHPVCNNIFAECRIGLSIDCRGMTWKQWNSQTDSSWQLERKANEMKYTQEPWKSRYPRLANILNDAPRQPLYNPVTSNVFIDCEHQLLALDRTITNLLDKVVVTDNLVINTHGTNGVRTARPDRLVANGFRTVNGTPEQPFDAGFTDPARGDFSLRPDAWISKNFPAFKPLPPRK